MRKKINKAYAISNAKIGFVSLVDKAANKRKFLITKAADGKSANFQSFGRIVKADSENHYITGVVYEPMVEDTDGNYMTEAEIEKAAHWFMKNNGKVDIQHCFEEAENVEVVETYVAKCDMEIDGEPIKKGTWLMTMEVADDSVWDAVQKGDITGFSMGGTGCYSEVDVDLDNVEKSESSLLTKIAKALGIDTVEKGAVKATYNRRVKSDNFYTAWTSLRDTLEGYEYDPEQGVWNWDYSADEEKIREALTDFSEIVTSILTSESVLKSLDKAASESTEVVEKAGKSLSSKNLKALQDINSSLSDFLSNFAEDESDDSSESEEEKTEKSVNKINKEEKDMTKPEVQALVVESVAKAMEPVVEALEGIAKDASTAEGEATGEGSTEETGEATAEDVAKMVTEAVEKAMEPVNAQLNVIKKSRALPSNLNSEPPNVEKGGSEHYLTGIL